MPWLLVWRSERVFLSLNRDLISLKGPGSRVGSPLARIILALELAMEPTSRGFSHQCVNLWSEKSTVPVCLFVSLPTTTSGAHAAFKLSTISSTIPSVNLHNNAEFCVCHAAPVHHVPFLPCSAYKSL